MPPAIYTTERLLVRHITPEDADAMFAVYGDAQAMQWVGDGEPLDHDSCVNWVGVTQRNYSTRGYGMSALVLAENCSVVGFCGIVHPGDQPEAEIKYALLREQWDRGLATEAVVGMLAYAVAEFGIERIIATVAPDNVASHKVLFKAGMSELHDVRNEDGTITKTFVWRART